MNEAYSNVGQKIHGGIKNLGLKSGDKVDDILATRYYIWTWCVRPVHPQRTTYTLLYINEVFMGLYFIHEDLDAEYIDSR